FRANTSPHTEQRSKKDQPEKSRPSPQWGQRLCRPRPSAVTISVQAEDVIANARRFRATPDWYCGPIPNTKRHCHRTAADADTGAWTVGPVTVGRRSGSLAKEAFLS